jgi:hypothetical protein
MDRTGYRTLRTIGAENIHYIGYNAAEQKLLIQFARGLAEYVYSEVPLTVAAAAEACTEHMGTWVRQNITHSPVSYAVERF